MVKYKLVCLVCHVEERMSPLARNPMETATREPIRECGGGKVGSQRQGGQGKERRRVDPWPHRRCELDYRPRSVSVRYPQDNDAHSPRLQTIIQPTGIPDGARVRTCGRH